MFVVVGMYIAVALRYVCPNVAYGVGLMFCVSVGEHTPKVSAWLRGTSLICLGGSLDVRIVQM